MSENISRKISFGILFFAKQNMETKRTINPYTAPSNITRVGCGFSFIFIRKNVHIPNTPEGRNPTTTNTGKVKIINRKNDGLDKARPKLLSSAAMTGPITPPIKKYPHKFRETRDMPSLKFSEPISACTAYGTSLRSLSNNRMSTNRTYVDLADFQIFSGFDSLLCLAI